MGIETKNPIKRDELEAYRKSLKIGDSLIYYESVPRSDGIGRSRMAKRRMLITGIYKNIITLQLGRMQRSMTLQEALIYNVKRRPKLRTDIHMPNEEERMEERRKKIMNLAYRGLSNAEIAEKTGYSQQAIAGVVRCAKLKKDKINERHIEIAKLRASGHGLNEIARMLGCSRSTVIRAIKKCEEKK